MANVIAYFDQSGSAGAVATEEDYAGLVAWVNGLDASAYQQLHHLVEQGWEDDLAGLTAQLDAALGAEPPGEEEAGVVGADLLEILRVRTEADTALALGNDDDTPAPAEAEASTGTADAGSGGPGAVS